MDNLESRGEVDPQEAADVTAPLGQSADNIETQTPEGTESSDDGTVTGVEQEETAYPWSDDDRFKGKTPEQMFEIVREADRYKGELGQKAKVADMLSREFGLTPERMEQIVQERMNSSRQKEIQQNPIAAVYGKVQALENELRMKDEEAKLNEVLSTKPELQEFRDEIINMGFSSHRDKTWGQIANIFEKAIAKGQEHAYHQTDIKQKTQATGVSRGGQKESVTLEDMQRMTAAELEAILPKANRL